MMNSSVIDIPMIYGNEEFRVCLFFIHSKARRRAWLPPVGGTTLLWVKTDVL